MLHGAETAIHYLQSNNSTHCQISYQITYMRVAQLWERYRLKHVRLVDYKIERISDRISLVTKRKHKVSIIIRDYSKKRGDDLKRGKPKCMHMFICLLRFYVNNKLTSIIYSLLKQPSSSFHLFHEGTQRPPENAAIKGTKAATSLHYFLLFSLFDHQFHRITEFSL